MAEAEAPEQGSTNNSPKTLSALKVAEIAGVLIALATFASDLLEGKNGLFAFAQWLCVGLGLCLIFAGQLKVLRALIERRLQRAVPQPEFRAAGITILVIAVLSLMVSLASNKLEPEGGVLASSYAKLHDLQDWLKITRSIDQERERLGTVIADPMRAVDISADRTRILFGVYNNTLLAATNVRVKVDVVVEGDIVATEKFKFPFIAYNSSVPIEIEVPRASRETHFCISYTPRTPESNVKPLDAASPETLQAERDNYQPKLLRWAFDAMVEREQLSAENFPSTTGKILSFVREGQTQREEIGYADECWRD